MACHPLLQLHEFFEDVGDEAPPPPGQDVSADQWLRAKGATPLQLEVADVCYANDFGCSLQTLGLREMITENQRYMHRGGGMMHVIQLMQPMYALYTCAELP